MSNTAKVRLTRDARRALSGRQLTGDQCINTAYGPHGVPEGEDRETYAKDAISDILTALFGPAGTMKETSDGDGWIPVPNEFALNEARRVVEESFRCYEGDTEDYIEETS